MLDFVLNNVMPLARRPEWEKKQMKQFEIARNLWVVEVVMKCIKEMDGKIKEE